ncbi:MAG: leucine-rich repeat domain-containing protein [Chlamydiota bacterium]
MIINKLEHANNYPLYLSEARKKEDTKQFFLIRAVTTVFNQALNLLKCILCISSSNNQPQKTRQYTKAKPEKSTHTRKKKSRPHSQASQAQVTQLMNLVGYFAEHVIGEGNRNVSRASNGAELAVKQKIKNSLRVWEKERGISRRQRNTRKILSTCILKAFDERWPGLNLSKLELSSLPDCFHHLQHLEVLDLSNNRIKVIPDSIYQLKNLKNLYLHNNKIENIKEDILCMPHLKEIYVHDNPDETQSKFVEFYIQVDYHNQFPYNRFEMYLDRSFDIKSIQQKIIDSPSQQAVCLRNQIRCWMILNNEAQVLNDQSIDDAFKNVMEHPGCPSLVAYLNQMKESKDFKIENHRPLVVGNICKQLLSANTNASFRDAFFSELHEYTTACSDRTTAGYVYFNILRRAHCENLNNVQLYQLLLGWYRYQQLDLVVAQCLPDHDESIEKFLHALLMLKDALQIPVDVKTTLFAEGQIADNICSEEELTVFCGSVLNLSSTLEQHKNILINNSIWREKILEGCPQYAKINKLFEQLMEEVSNCLFDEAFNHEAFNTLINNNPMLRTLIFGITGNPKINLSLVLQKKLKTAENLNSNDIETLSNNIMIKKNLALQSLVRKKTDLFLTNFDF